MVVRRSVLVALLTATSGLWLGCGRAAPPADAAGANDASDAGEARTDAEEIEEPLVCPDAAAIEDAAHDASSGPQTCGGEVAVAGLTPFGPFVARNVSSMIGYGDCPMLSLFFDDGENDAGFTGIWLAVNLPYGGSLKTPSGTIRVDGALNTLLSPTLGASRTVPVTIEIGAADPLFDSNGRVAVTAASDAGTAGRMTGTLDADTGCGHIKGTFSVPYCRANGCVGILP
jgi:hypothetical protein